jgi:hypothetical protein
MAVATPTTKTPIYTGPEDLTIEMPESMWQRIAAEAYVPENERAMRLFPETRTSPRMHALVARAYW